MGNDLFRRRREAVRSPSGSGAPMSRAELAEAVNKQMASTGTSGWLDADAIGRYERGEVRWPRKARREALRAVLGVASDGDLGFYTTWPARSPEREAAGDRLDVPFLTEAAVGDLVITIGVTRRSGRGPAHATRARVSLADAAGPAGSAPGDGPPATIRIEVVVRDEPGPGSS